MNATRKSNGFARACALIITIILLSFGIWFSYDQKTESALITYLAMAVTLFYFLHPNITHFKAGREGIEARVEQKLDEIEKLMQQIRAFVMPFAELSYILEKRSTYIFQPPPRADHLRIQKQLDTAFLDIGITKKQIEEIKKHLHEGRHLDLCNTIRKKLKPSTNKGMMN